MSGFVTINGKSYESLGGDRVRDPKTKKIYSITDLANRSFQSSQSRYIDLGSGNDFRNASIMSTDITIGLPELSPEAAALLRKIVLLIGAGALLIVGTTLLAKYVRPLSASFSF